MMLKIQQLYYKNICMIKARYFTTIVPLFLAFFLPAVLTANNGFEFIENQNQWPSNIEYKLSLKNLRVFLEKDKIKYLLINPEDIDRIHDAHHGWLKDPGPLTIDGHVFSMNFLNANPNPGFTEFEMNPHYFNYFLGNDKSKWAGHVRSFNVIQYDDLYDGVDLQMYSNGDHLKYDLIVSAGADPYAIQFDYQGLDDIFLKDGDLHIKNTISDMLELKPYAYQIINGVEVAVECHFVLDDNKLSFAFPKGYHEDEILVIDPEIVFATLTGATVDNWGTTACFDDEGNAFGGSIAFRLPFNSSNDGEYPTTDGAFQTEFGGGTGNNGTDWAISKFTPEGDALIYSTYIGGKDNEFPHSTIVNSKNQLVIYGTTSSEDFPLSDNAIQDEHAGGFNIEINNIEYINGTDIAIVILEEDGSDIVGSTYMGGSGLDGLNFSVFLGFNYGEEARGEVNLDTDDNIYIGSMTNSSNFPTTENAFQEDIVTGGTSGVLFKLNPDASELEWSTLIGDAGDDAVYSVKIAEDNSVYIAGGTTSSDLPIVAGGLNETFGGGQVDGYVAHFSADGETMLHGSFLGTASADQAYFLEIGPQGFIYIFGSTAIGSGYPTTGTGFEVVDGAHFIHKLSTDLATTEFSTLFGSGLAVNISPTAFLVDNCRRIYISGWGGDLPNSNTSTLDLPVTDDAFQDQTDGSDFYFSVFGPDMSSLDHATFFGDPDVSEHVDGGTSRFDKKGSVYQAVCAGCGGGDFPTTDGAYSSINGSGNCNMGLIKFEFEANSVFADFSFEEPGCAPDSIQFTNESTNGLDYTWDFGDGSPTTNQENPMHVFTEAGTYTVTLTVDNINTCNETASITKTITLIGSPDATFTPVTFCEGDTETKALIPVNAGGVWLSEFVDDDGNFDPDGLEAGSYPVTYTVGGADCEDTFTADVIINPLPDAGFTGLAAEYCLDAGEVVLTPNVEGGSFSYSIDNNTTIIELDGNILNIADVGVGEVLVTYTITNEFDCTYSSVESAFIFDFPDPEFTPVIVCIGSTGQFFMNPVTTGGTFEGVGMDPDGAFEPDGLEIGEYNVTYTITVNGCTSTLTLINQVVDGPDPEFTTVTVCQGASAQLIPVTTGGVWSGEGMDADGNFNSSGLAAGEYDVTYTVGPEECQSILSKSNIVEEVLDPAFEAVTVCQGDNADLTAVTAGGLWTGEGMNDNGNFDSDGLEAGEYEVTYTVGEGECETNLSLVNIVIAVISADFDPVTVCVGESATLSAENQGGVWSGEGMDENGNFDSAGLEAGEYDVTYTIGDAECESSVSLVNTVLAQADPAFEAVELCTGADPEELEAVSSGGTWEGEGMDEDGNFDPSGLDPGSYEVTYTVGEGACADALTLENVVLEGAEPEITPVIVCEGDDETFLILADPPGGSFSGPGTNELNNVWDPTDLDCGTYTIEYTVETADGCIGVTSEEFEVSCEFPDIDWFESECLEDGTPAFIFKFRVDEGNGGPFNVSGDYEGVVESGEQIEVLVENPDGEQIYLFVTEEGNPCTEESFKNPPDCPICDPDAGELPDDLVIMCHDETITVETIGAVIDPGNELVYILHTEPVDEIGDVLEMNEDGFFSLQSVDGAETLTTYYISAVVAPSDQLPDFDLDDICTDIEPGPPVVWLNPVEIDIDDDCINHLGTTTLFYSFSGGLPEYDDDTYYLTQGDLEITEDDEIGVGDVLSIDYTDGDEYEIQVTDDLGCNAAEDGTISCAKCPYLGFMPSASQVICSDETVSAQNSITNSDTLAVIYVIHDDDKDLPGNILATNLSGTFSFDDLEDGEYLTNYYLSAIVGPPGDDGTPDLDNNCTDVILGPLVVWLAPLEITAEVICNNILGVAYINYIIKGGYPEYDGDEYYTVAGDYTSDEEEFNADNNSFTVPNLVDGTTYIIEVSDDKGCMDNSESTVVGCDKLSIDLTHFEGQISGAVNQLTWAWSDASIWSSMELQSSENGFDFESLVSLEADKMTASKEYLFNDFNHQDETRFYRLMIMESNGQINFTSSISLVRNSAQFGLHEVYPVPTNDELFIDFSSPNQTSIELSLQSLNGQVMLQQTLDIEAGNNSLKLRLANYPAGMYLMKIQSGSEIWMEKVIVD